MNSNRVGVLWVTKGIPAPQGSKTPIGRTKTGRPILIESSKKVAPWRQALAIDAGKELATIGRPLSGALSATISFYLPRPKRAWGDPHTRPTVYPDLDKLVRSTFDGIAQGGLIENDSHFVEISAEKRYVLLPDVCVLDRCLYCSDSLPEAGAVISLKEISV